MVNQKKKEEGKGLKLGGKSEKKEEEKKEKEEQKEEVKAMLSARLRNQTPELSARLMLSAAATHGWRSPFTQGLALLLEAGMRPWLSPPPRFYEDSFDKKRDEFAEKNLPKFYPELHKTGVPIVWVHGNGNCLDNATLHACKIATQRSFEFRVQKGLHFVGNFPVYLNYLQSTLALGYSDDEFDSHCSVYFENKAWQATVHDLPSSFLLNRPIAFFYPQVSCYCLVFAFLCGWPG